jgi:ligand-binding sensor domain-containing protein/two-component sensor histidine kinase
LLFIGALFTRAERLPIKSYTTTDGLESSYIQHIFQDSHGFMWFATRNGLSRYDGHQFTTYNTEHGLPHSTINWVLESRSGVYWVATNGGGVCRFNPDGDGSARRQSQSLFTVYPLGDQLETNRVNVLCEDRNGRIWAGTDGGVFRLETTNEGDQFQRIKLGSKTYQEDDAGVSALIEDRRGVIWVAANSILHRLLPDGKIEHYTPQQGLLTGGIWTLLEDREGRLWAGAVQGLYELAPEPGPHRSILVRRYTTGDGLPHNIVLAITQTADDHLWIGTADGLVEFDGQRMHKITRAQGLSEKGVARITEDRDGNLWMSTYGSGVLRLIRNGFTSYGEADSPGFTQIYSIFEGDDGLFTVNESGHISQLSQEQITSAQLPAPQKPNDFWMAQRAFRDHAGEWWAVAPDKLYRFPKASSIKELATMRPKAVYTKRDGLPDENVHRFYEDSRGDLWFGVPVNARNRLLRWERATNRFHRYTEADGLPAFNAPFAFCEDRAGNLWIGFYDGGVARFRDGRFVLFTAADGWPAGVITNLFLDQEGRLWISSNQSGVCRIDDPEADHPNLIKYSAANGLASNDARCITEDQWGRMYIGTVRGVDRLDLQSGHIKHYTEADGLAAEFVICARRDRRGWLWFGTMKGLSRLIPESDRPASPPPVLITALRVAGTSYQVSELGQSEASGLVFDPHQNQLQIDFTGLTFALGEHLRFRYRLEGAESAWNPITRQRTVNYASLRPGSYRFVVEAINADGQLSPSPAVISFTIRPPLWQRWWSITLTVALIGIGLYGLHRYRLARMLEIERVRTRIAADLHDDIGSSLSQSAIISEVLHKQVSPREPNIDRNLSLMARVSREAVDSMSDIVWAINPQRDHLYDLVRRMRRFASETFPASGIDFRFEAPDSAHDLRLGADLRRQVFLIFKESVNNIVRHAACTEAAINLRIEGSWLILKMIDNGKGINGRRLVEGNGLVSMRKRAENLGGALQIANGAGNGTTIILKIPYGY